MDWEDMGDIRDEKNEQDGREVRGGPSIKAEMRRQPDESLNYREDVRSEGQVQKFATNIPTKI